MDTQNPTHSPVSSLPPPTPVERFPQIAAPLLCGAALIGIFVVDSDVARAVLALTAALLLVDRHRFKQLAAAFQGLRAEHDSLVDQVRGNHEEQQKVTTELSASMQSLGVKLIGFERALEETRASIPPRSELSALQAQFAGFAAQSRRGFPRAAVAAFMVLVAVCVYQAAALRSATPKIRSAFAAPVSATTEMELLQLRDEVQKELASLRSAREGSSTDGDGFVTEANAEELLNGDELLNNPEAIIVDTGTHAVTTDVSSNSGTAAADQDPSRAQLATGYRAAKSAR